MERRTTTTTERISPARFKQVTKSLAELGKMDEINKYFLFLNHVPKHVRLKGGNRRLLTNLQQEYFVYDLYDVIKTEAVPLSFDRNVYFINFTEFDKQFPTYINFLRNPVDKVLSRMSSQDGDVKGDYYYKCLTSKQNNCNFKTGETYDLSIPYFCGHDPRCMVLNNEWALKTAKKNVVRYFPVVGVLEEFNATLEILENKIPYFFKGAQKIYEKDIMNIRRNNEKPRAPKVMTEKLKKSLIHELDFYEWIRARLFDQLKALYGEHSPH
ncbi:hypothetical protein JTB14_030147 [Gonioctena quinquepunctata]|nr:hypothetical protein JTB14_030147 [Gonioctena quinquepunctata]